MRSYFKTTNGKLYKDMIKGNLLATYDSPPDDGGGGGGAVAADGTPFAGGAILALEQGGTKCCD